MKLLRLLIAPLALASLAFAAPANAACPSTGNTVGTDTAAIIADLNVICAAVPSGAGLSATQLPATLGPKTQALSLSVTQASDGSFGTSVPITRPADTTPYGAVDVVGTAQSFVICAGAGEYTITRSRLVINDNALIASESYYTLELYSVTPPSAYADNAAWDIPAGDRASYLGSINLGVPIDRGSTLTVEADNLNKQITCAGTTVFGYLVTSAGYTPSASRVYNVELHSVKAY